MSLTDELKEQYEKEIALVQPRRQDLAIEGVKFSVVGLEFTGPVTLPQFEVLANTVTYFGKALLFVMGDMSNYGHAAWGEKYSQFEDHSRYEYGTLKTAAWVCRRIPIERRRPELSYSHHQEIAPLEPEDQDRIMDQAIEGQWTVSQTRKAVKALQTGNDLQRPIKRIGFDEWWMLEGHTIKGEYEATQACWKACKTGTCEGWEE